MGHAQGALPWSTDLSLSFCGEDAWGPGRVAHSLHLILPRHILTRGPGLRVEHQGGVPKRLWVSQSQSPNHHLGTHQLNNLSEPQFPH